METFKKTHHWITFSVDLSKIQPRQWIMLGECQSKCEHIALVPLQPKTSERLHQIYLAKGVAATTAIEGNTLTEDQVLEHLDGKLSLPISQQYQQKEIDNIISLCNLILKKIGENEPIPLTAESIKYFNKEILKDLPLEEGIVPGQIRTYSVGVAKYRGAPAEDCELLLQKLCAWLTGTDFKADDKLKIVYGILKAIIAHIYMAWIHPFGDGNGRTARLIELMVLIDAGVPSAAAHLLSNHYNQTRQEYYRHLAIASESGGDLIPFITYAIQGFLDGLRQQMKNIWEQQWKIAWSDYVHEVFPDKSSPTQDRRRHLVLDLTAKGIPVPMNQIAELSPRVAREYARKTPKTISRDLNELLNMKLIEKTPEGYRALKETILRFLPPTMRRNDDSKN
jgi:Fic family protein